VSPDGTGQKRDKKVSAHSTPTRMQSHPLSLSRARADTFAHKLQAGNVEILTLSHTQFVYFFGTKKCGWVHNRDGVRDFFPNVKLVRLVC